MQIGESDAPQTVRWSDRLSSDGEIASPTVNLDRRGMFAATILEAAPMLPLEKRFDGREITTGDSEEKLRARSAGRHLGIGHKTVDDFLCPRRDVVAFGTAASVEINPAEQLAAVELTEHDPDAVGPLAVCPPFRLVTRRPGRRVVGGRQSPRLRIIWDLRRPTVPHLLPPTDPNGAISQIGEREGSGLADRIAGCRVGARRPAANSTRCRGRDCGFRANPRPGPRYGPRWAGRGPILPGRGDDGSSAIEHQLAPAKLLGRFSQRQLILAWRTGLLAESFP